MKGPQTVLSPGMMIICPPFSAARWSCLGEDGLDQLLLSFSWTPPGSLTGSMAALMYNSGVHYKPVCTLLLFFYC